MAKAETGCVNSLNSNIYTSTSSTQGYAYVNYASSPFVPFGDPGVPCPYYRSFTYIPGNPRCCIAGNCNVNYYLINFTRAACPIDDQIWILMLGAMPLSLYSFRNKFRGLAS